MGTGTPTTLAPTNAPTTGTPTTLAPTNAPTGTPTTLAPTNAPTTGTPTTQEPTLTPTAVPTTVAPSLIPTAAPTSAPTTLAPTQSPTITLPPSTKAPTDPIIYCTCKGTCDVLADPHVTTFNGNKFTEGQNSTWLSMYTNPQFDVAGFVEGPANAQIFLKEISFVDHSSVSNNKTTTFYADECTGQKYSHNVTQTYSVPDFDQTITVTAQCKKGPKGCVEDSQDPLKACQWYLNAVIEKEDVLPKSTGGIDTSDFNAVENYFESEGVCREGDVTKDKQWSCTCPN